MELVAISAALPPDVQRAIYFQTVRTRYKVNMRTAYDVIDDIVRNYKQFDPAKAEQSKDYKGSSYRVDQYPGMMCVIRYWYERGTSIQLVTKNNTVITLFDCGGCSLYTMRPHFTNCFYAKVGAAVLVELECSLPPSPCVGHHMMEEYRKHTTHERQLLGMS
jgi:hypothetical protein